VVTRPPLLCRLRVSAHGMGHLPSQVKSSEANPHSTAHTAHRASVLSVCVCARAKGLGTCHALSTFLTNNFRAGFTFLEYEFTRAIHILTYAHFFCLRGALVASCLRGALPCVEWRAGL
jgi:hypothetical protein